MRIFEVFVFWRLLWFHPWLVLNLINLYQFIKVWLLKHRSMMLNFNPIDPPWNKKINTWKTVGSFLWWAKPGRILWMTSCCVSNDPWKMQMRRNDVFWSKDLLAAFEIASSVGISSYHWVLVFQKRWRKWSNICDQCCKAPWMQEDMLLWTICKGRICFLRKINNVLLKHQAYIWLISYVY